MNYLSRRKFLELTAVGLVPLGIRHLTKNAVAKPHVLKFYKSLLCGCWSAWVDHMRHARFQVMIIDNSDLLSIKEYLGVPSDQESCHSSVIDGYAIEGQRFSAFAER